MYTVVRVDDYNHGKITMESVRMTIHSDRCSGDL
jgi:hypothetical protein